MLRGSKRGFEQRSVTVQVCYSTVMDGEEREGKKQIEDETTGELGEDADDEESEDTSPLLGMVEVRESPHGGLGVFALRDFEKGEVVLREIPFMVSC